MDRDKHVPVNRIAERIRHARIRSVFFVFLGRPLIGEQAKETLVAMRETKRHRYVRAFHHEKRGPARGEERVLYFSHEQLSRNVVR